MEDFGPVRFLRPINQDTRYINHTKKQVCRLASIRTVKKTDLMCQNKGDVSSSVVTC